MGTLGDFLSPEAGQKRRQWLDETLGYYIPPELRGIVGLAAEVNPVTNIERASTSAKRVADPNLSGWDRMAAAGDTAVNMASVLAPVAASSKAGVPAANAIVEALTAASPMKGAVGDFAANESGALKLYHGSPHDFDKFSMDKIGTGEGAQAYGHGLYFAENEAIAKGYRDALSPNRVAVDGRIVDSPVTQAAAKFSPNPDDYIKALTVQRDRAARNLEGAVSDPELGSLMADIYKSEIASIDAKIAELQPLSGGWFHTKPDGRMYEVQINANPEDFLDWDAPFASADDVERFAARFDAVDPALRKRIEDFGYVRQQMGQPMPDGNDIIREVMGGIGSKDAARASETMREAGIPGIKYLDAGSRGAGDGSRNYVVFDENLISIVRKYGWAAAAPMLAQMGMTPEQAKAQYEAQQ